MPSWLKKAFGKKDEREPPPSPATRPSTSGTQSSSSSQQRPTQSRNPSQRSNTPSSSSRIYSGVVHSGSTAPLPRPQSRTRVSTHDLTMAAVTLGVAPPPSPHPVVYSPSSSATSGLRPDLHQQQIDSDLAMAYSLAQQEQQSGMSSSGGGQQQMQSSPPQAPPQAQRPLPPLPHHQQQHPGMPVTSPFGEAVSLPPPPAGTRPDLAMAAALAESQFAARQADELARTTEAVYQAAVDKALEASLQTVSYDDILRDIKLWIIDLAASTDDVLAALDSIVKQRQDVAVKLEKALDEDDDRKIRKLGWMAEQLPSVEEKLRNLADKMMPIGVAVVELQDLRHHIGATSPPLEEAGRQRDFILVRLFKAMEDAGLRPPSRSSDYYSDGGVNSDGAGPSTSAAAAAAAGGSSRPATPLQAPTDLRDLVAALIEEAQKLPKMPKRRKSSGSIATSATTATTSLADPWEVRELPATPSGGGGGGNGGGGGEGTPESAAPAAPVAAVAAASVGLISSLGKENKKEKPEEEIQQERNDLDEIEQLPSAPEQEASSSDVLATPTGNDLISFAEEEEVEVEEEVDNTLPAAEALQPHRLAISEEEEGEEENEDQPQEEQQQNTFTAAAPSSTPPSIIPPSSPYVDEQQLQQAQQGEITSTPSVIPNGDNVITDAHIEEKKNTTTAVTNKKTPLWRRLSTRTPPSTSTPGSGASSSIPSATSTPSSSQQQQQQRRSSPGTFTTPVPFQLSTSRWKAKGPSEAPTAADTLRRMPALISLHYEMEKDSGVVADAVGWTAGPATSNNNNHNNKIEVGPAVAIPPPAALNIGTSFETPEEMVTFVKSQAEGSFPSIVPSRFDTGSRWSVICAAAGVYEALTIAIDELSSWEIKTPSTAGTAGAASVVLEAHRLVDYLARVSSILSTVAHTHDPLRHALVKHRLPWEESLTTQVRWAAQIAGIAVISQAIDVSEEAERTKGPWQRQAVLKPLGHGVKAAFSVHQLAGGFGSEASAACEYLVERTVHYARMIDPKWFRGHKVVAS